MATVTQRTTQFVPTTINIMVQVLLSPLETSVIDRSPANAKEDGDEAASDGTLVLTPTYKIALIVAMSVTAIAGMATMAMGATWAEPSQIQAIGRDTAAIVWKLGMGAFVGLIAGKSLS